MDSELYYGLVRYIGSGKMPRGLKEEDRRKIEGVSQGYTVKNAKLYKENRIVATKQERERIIREIHDGPLGGHQGQNNTFNRIARTHYWPEMRKDIQEYVRTCALCQKRARGKEVAPLESIDRSPEPFRHVGIDIMGPLPITMTGKRYVVVAIDLFTKWVEARALQDADAQSIAAFIHEDIICRHGTPQFLTSDQGTEFVNEMIRALTDKFKIKHIRTTPYHPQANGQTERTNQTMKNLLAKLASGHTGTWDHYLPSALYIVRTTRQSSIRYSPADLIYGREMCQDTSQEIEERLTRNIQQLQDVRNDAAKFIRRAQERQKASYDKKAGRTEILKIGDKVLLFRDMVEASWSAKLEPKWEGPYIIQKVKGTTHWLRTLEGNILPKSAHRNRLKKYYDRA